jgi:hypothetical protein
VCPQSTQENIKKSLKKETLERIKINKKLKKSNKIKKNQKKN